MGPQLEPVSRGSPGDSTHPPLCLSPLPLSLSPPHPPPPGGLGSRYAVYHRCIDPAMAKKAAPVVAAPGAIGPVVTEENKATVVDTPEVVR